jgi:transposase
LEQIACPNHDSELGIQAMNTELKVYARRIDTALAPLAWLWNYPSARRCWDSVYNYTTSGFFGFLPPIGKVKLVTTGRVIGTTFYVVDVTILEIETEEHSPLTKKTGTRTVTFHNSVNIKSYTNITEPIFTNCKDSTLSDLEWKSIQPIFKSKKSHSNQKHDIRTQVEGILVKQVTGIAWRKVKFNSGTWINAAERYRTWQRSGVWGKAILALNNIRSKHQVN